ncbi:MAG: thymidine phosphorylase, partial [Gemmatimonadota bacterium]
MTSIHPAALIERKRDGGELAAGELRGFLDAFMAGNVADYQMSAMLMAVFFQGLSPAELQTMTRCIIDSGERLDFSGSSAPAVDKHSTGGVGDKVSLVLAPLLAEYGLRVPMMSGRGLGHSGGTLDKLEAIPGFRTDMQLDEFRATVDELGCAMIGQTGQITPLDGRLYALRDVTGTVESVPLISASIVSKKVAEGISGLVLDVKVGRGAFMTDEAAARDLAETMVGLAESLGLHASALLTAMDEPLGCMVGNALEVREAVECLRGDGPADLRDVTLELCTEAVMVAGESADEVSVRSELAALLDGGAA